ncbi:MAG: tRNA (N6-isopentenyl adenosine(37)-C2)-methylthiotransferase MiaB [Dissulfurispiraceae bacterium]
MRKYCIVTFGCQMNVHDSEKISGILKAEGCIQTDDPRNADIVIFNTCSIRQKAEQKFYSELGRMKALKKKKPELQITVAGCIAQQEGRNLLKRASFVDNIIGPQNIHMLSATLSKISDVIAIQDNHDITEVQLPVSRSDGSRAWINIMYGCDNFCSYCVVPYTRGREKSRVSQSIIAEVTILSKQGYKEITLLGQNVNSYRSDLDFNGLLRQLNEVNGLRRIRFLTSHPKDLSDELIDEIKSLEKVCEHIHLPLQSGSTKILSLMNRKYTFEEYLNKIHKLRMAIPTIAITSDIISGFPQESDEDHKFTLHALEQIQFDGIFAFKYSPRPNTLAAVMDGQVDEAVKADRLHQIFSIQDLITETKNKELEGTLQEVLIEGESQDKPGYHVGKTRTNKIVIIPSTYPMTKGDLVTIRIARAARHSLEGAPPN